MLKPPNWLARFSKQKIQTAKNTRWSLIAFRALRFSTLRTKLVAAFIGIGIFTATTIALVNGYTTRLEFTKIADQSLVSSASQVSGQLDSYLNSNAKRVSSLAQFSDISSYLALSSDQRFGSIFGRNVTSLLYNEVSGPTSEITYARGLAIADANGEVILSTDFPEIGQNWLDRMYFQQAISVKSRSYVSISPINFSLDNKPFFYITAPIFSREFKLLGVLVGRYDAHVFQDIMAANNERAGAQSYGILVDENYVYLANGVDTDTLYKIMTLPDANQISMLQTNGALPKTGLSSLSLGQLQLQQKISQAPPSPFFETQDVGSRDQIYQAAIYRLGTQPWMVIFFQPQEIFLNLAATQTRNILLVTLASTVVVIALAYLFARQLTIPIVKLTKSAEEIAKGNLLARAEVETEDEIGLLAKTMNAMASTIRGSIETLEQRVAERTRDLNVASIVSREITQELDLSKLLPGLVEGTKAGFELYYASVFLFDPNTSELLLEAGTGEEGAHMKEEAKSFYISARPSLVAEAAREQKSVVINDVNQSTIYFKNPHLPRTQSEAVFPMVVGDELVGVLDLQSVLTDRFQSNDIQIFSTLAEQIAIAVRNAQLYAKQEHVAQELARTDLMKSQFLASMSHELRTPLNAIINFTELVTIGSMGEINEQQKEVLTHSLNSSKHLLQLINDVLDISKIQAGRLTLFVEENVNLKEEITAVLGIAEPLLQKQNELYDRHVQLVTDIEVGLPLVKCDRRRVKQVLLNLLSNAIKFTDKGSITLSVKQQKDQIRFGVLDTGGGISEELQSQIFEPFIQTIDGIKYAEGTGLGLPIARSLIEAHGGNLWLESELGQGSAFFFSLPLVYHPTLAR